MTRHDSPHLSRESRIPLAWVRELLTSNEAVDRIATVVENRPQGVPIRDALAHALPFLGHVLEDRAERESAHA